MVVSGAGGLFRETMGYGSVLNAIPRI